MFSSTLPKSPVSSEATAAPTTFISYLKIRSSLGELENKSRHRCIDHLLDYIDNK